MARTCLVANPAAGRGRGGRMLPGVREALSGLGITEVRLTQGVGDERRLAREAAAEGVDTIIALGGDGTWGNAARGILESGQPARLALIAAGTGNDFGHSLGLPTHDVRAMAQVAAGKGERRVDLGRVDDIPFLNVAGFGFETAVLEALDGVRLLRGPLLYVATAIPRLFSFTAPSASLSIDGESARPRTTYLALIASNGPRFGGGFQIAPGASPSDGRLDLIAVRDAGVARRAAIFVRARLGTHVGQPEVERRAIRSLAVQFDAVPLVDIDGELHRARTRDVRIDVLPGALRVAVANGSR